MPPAERWPLSDLALSRRLERAEALTNAALIATGAGASFERGGAYALFDGVGSPLTQTFCLGIFETPTDDDLDAIEAFFTSRGAGVFHEVSPLAGMATLDVLSRRGYRPIELTSILYQPIARNDDDESRVRTRIALRDEAELWGETAADGWSEAPEIRDFIRDLGRRSVTSEGMLAFVAEIEGRPVATGALSIRDGVALLAGASTVPAARNQGAQRALLRARLRHAADAGCDLAMMGASPGSASQRNAERQGFRIAYTRTKWGK